MSPIMRIGAIAVAAFVPITCSAFTVSDAYVSVVADGMTTWYQPPNLPAFVTGYVVTVAATDVKTWPGYGATNSCDTMRMFYSVNGGALNYLNLPFMENVDGGDKWGGTLDLAELGPGDRLYFYYRGYADGQGYNPTNEFGAWTQTVYYGFWTVRVANVSSSAAFGGTVTNSSTGSRISGARVTWGHYSSTSDSSGNYVFSMVPCASNILVVSQAGFQSFAQGFAPACQLSSIKNIGLWPSNSHSASFGGQVTDAVTGLPLAAASIRWGPFSATTGVDGIYQLFDVPCQVYTLTVARTGYGGFSAEYEPLCLASSVKNVALSPLAVPFLVDAECAVSPALVAPGSNIVVSYRISNSGGSSLSVGLGCSIRKSGTPTWISDEPGDLYRSVPPGVSTQTRAFTIPGDAHGSYDVAWGIWEVIGIGSPWEIVQQDGKLVVNRSPSQPGSVYMRHDAAIDTGQSSIDAITKNHKPVFSWGASADADGDVVVGYFVSRVDSTPDEDDVWVTETNWGPGFFDAAIPEGTHVLYVRAKDSMGATGAVAALTFRVDKTAPVPPSLDYPPEDEILSDTSPPLDWGNVTDVWKYDVFVRDAGFPWLDSRSSNGLSSSIWTVSPDLGLKDWGWQVKAWDVAGNEGEFGMNGQTGAWSHFRIGTAREIQISPATLSFDAADAATPIYVEIDWMEDGSHTHRPSDEAIARIVRAFACEGYAIHLDISDAIPHQAAIDVLDSPSASPDVVAIRNQFFDHAGDPRYYYSIWAHAFSRYGQLTSSSGIADLPGQIHLVTLGENAEYAELHAGTFVHEFGHNLGQTHGGADHNNYKPNYLSVMNYLYQFPGVGGGMVINGLASGDPGMNDYGYSHGTAANLNEDDLDEVEGLGFGRPVDWDCNGVAMSRHANNDINGQTDSSQTRCDEERGRSVLEDFDNWSGVATAVRAAATGKRKAASRPSEICQSPKEYVRVLEQRKRSDTAISDAVEVSGIGDDPVELGDAAKFTIANSGQVALNITSIVPSVSAPWLKTWPATPFAVPGGQSRGVVVYVDFSLAPVGQTTRRLRVYSDDSDENPYPNAVDVQVTAYDRGTIQFGSATYSTNESGGIARLYVNRSGGSFGSASVDYRTVSGSAITGSDFTPASGTLSWSDGESGSRQFDVQIVDDTIAEAAEVFTGLLSNVTGASAGNPDSAAVVIEGPNDQRGTIQFKAGNYSASEGVGSVRLWVERTGGTFGSASVVYSTSNGSAISGSDFAYTSSTLSWSDGDGEDKFFDVTIVDDLAAENAETFTGVLRSATGASLGTPSAAVVTIEGPNDQPVGTIQFKSANYTVSEGGGSVRLYVSRTGGSFGAAGVNYGTVNGSAVSGSDFDPAGGSLSWATGDDGDKHFDVTIHDDNSPENSETFTGLLTSVTGATLGAPSRTTVTISGPNDQPSNPEIAVTPGVVHFGDVEVGSVSTASLAVENVGDGTLTGQASANGPFSVTSGGSYALPADDGQPVTISFQPMSDGLHVGTVIFTGGGGQSIVVDGRAHRRDVDSDGDGMSDWEEILAGSSPSNSGSLFVLSMPDSPVDPSGQGRIIRWWSTNDHVYHVDRSTNVLGGGIDTIASNLPASPPVNTHTDESTAVGGTYFYRVRSESR
jgi:hypothetical protein